MENVALCAAIILTPACSLLYSVSDSAEQDGSTAEVCADNLISDGSFDNGSGDWRGADDTAVSITVEDSPHDGVLSACSTQVSKLQIRYEQSIGTSDLMGGETIYVRAQFRSPAAERVDFHIRFKDVNNDLQTVFGQTLYLSANWTMLPSSYQFDPQDVDMLNASELAVLRLSYEAVGTAVGDCVYLDDICLVILKGE